MFYLNLLRTVALFVVVVVVVVVVVLLDVDLHYCTVRYEPLDGMRKTTAIAGRPMRMGPRCEFWRANFCLVFVRAIQTTRSEIRNERRNE